MRVIVVGASWRFAASGIAFALAGCGESANNSLWDRIAAAPSAAMPARAPEIVPTAQAMAGRWTLTMPGTGACGMTFGAAAEGGIALDGPCPGKFSASHSWSIEPTGLFLRDQRGAVLAQLRMTEPGRLEGQTADGAQVLLGR